jgi:hypothetical protein
MISRTSCAHRQALAVLAAHCSASSREGTSTTQNPPTTSLVSGNGEEHRESIRAFLAMIDPNTGYIGDD